MLDLEMCVDILDNARQELASRKLCRGVMAQRANGRQRAYCKPWADNVEYLDGLGALTRAMLQMEKQTGQWIPHEYCRIEGYLMGILRHGIQQIMEEYGKAYLIPDMPSNDTAALAAFCDMRWVSKGNVVDLFERSAIEIERREGMYGRTR